VNKKSGTPKVHQANGIIYGLNIRRKSLQIKSQAKNWKESYLD